MLVSLSISNFILIDSLHLDFQNGLTVISGETGAGKSIILDALELILGSRVSPKYVKNPQKPAVLCAEFLVEGMPELQQLLAQNSFEGTNIIIKRVFSVDGKSKNYINDTLASVALISLLAEHLIEISTQHDQKGLFDPGMHRKFLDDSLNIPSLLNTVAGKFEQYHQLNQQLILLRTTQAQAEDEKCFLQHVIDELSTLRPQYGEEGELIEKRNKLREIAKIQGAMTIINQKINAGDGIISMLNHILKEFNKANLHDLEIIGYFERALIEVTEGNSSLQSMLKAAHDEQELNRIEERLFALKGVARKYNVLPDQLPEYLEKTQQKLDLIINYDQRYLELTQQMEQAKGEYLNFAEELSYKRKEGGVNLENRVAQELHSLKMGAASFKIEITSMPQDKWSVAGIDKVRFIGQTNPGSQADLINKIASGGELSRFFLAIKVAISSNKSVNTIIFDEVDVGVGGAVATSIGKKLATIAAGTQVLIITHQPQVASFSNNHFLVEKYMHEGETLVKVKKLSEKEKQQEIARMLSGDHINDSAIEAANQLILQAKLVA